MRIPFRGDDLAVARLKARELVEHLRGETSDPRYDSSKLPWIVVWTRDAARFYVPDKARGLTIDGEGPVMLFQPLSREKCILRVALEPENFEMVGDVPSEAEFAKVRPLPLSSSKPLSTTNRFKPLVEEMGCAGDDQLICALSLIHI